MTYLIKLDDTGSPTGYPVHEDNFRALFPGSYFPALLTPADVAATGFALWEFSQQPALQRYEKMEEGPYRLGDDGRYFQNWLIVPMTDEEKAGVDAAEAAKVRGDRNRRLFMTDWIFAPDAPLDQQQIQQYMVYRQALRDVPAQPGFPWTIDWPTAPQ